MDYLDITYQVMLLQNNFYIEPWGVPYVQQIGTKYMSSNT
jgi:hypothetical protein